MENPQRHGKSYNKWLSDQAGLSHRDRLCYVIYEAPKQNPESFDVLLDLLRQAGYEIKGNPAIPALRGVGQKRFSRMDTLAPGYSIAKPKAIITGVRQQTRRSATPKH